VDPLKITKWTAWPIVLGGIVSQVARKLWKLIKREPVVFVAALAILAQAGVKAIDTGHFSFVVWMTYAFQMAMALVARELVVPGDKHEALKELVSETIVELEAEYQKKLNDHLTRIEGERKGDVN
jgi:hypothetical protein